MNQVLPDWDDGKGIFSQLNLMAAMPWGGTVDADGLDIAYHGQRSGDKFVTSMVYKWIDNDTAELTENGIRKICSALTARYWQKWSHLWQTYTAEYDPLRTYNITESGTSSGTKGGDVTGTRTPNLTTKDVLDQLDKSSHDRTDTLTHGENISTLGEISYGSTVNTNDKLTHGESISTAGTLTRTDEHKVNGFNSSEPVNASFDSRSDTTSNSEVHTGTDETTKTETHSGSDLSEITEHHTGVDKNVANESSQLDRDSTNTRTETGTEQTKETRDLSESASYSRTRSGNMYRSPAELISYDREFWLTDYFAIVFSDVDDMLTLAIYSESPVNQTIY